LFNLEVGSREDDINRPRASARRQRQLQGAALRGCSRHDARGSSGHLFGQRHLKWESFARINAVWNVYVRVSVDRCRWWRRGYRHTACCTGAEEHPKRRADR
jgi:hypothetical protein